MPMPKFQNNHIFAQFDGVPSLIAEEARVQFEHCLNSLAMHEQFGKLCIEPMAAGNDFWFSGDDWRTQYRPYSVSAEGILMIPVKGSLLADFPWAFGNMATGYQYISQAIDRGMADPAVKGIIFSVNSPGGSVQEAFDLGDKIFAMRGVKPMQVIGEAAYSAAYLVPSAAGAINLTRTGDAGSIGVVTMHIDYSKMLENAGIKVTYISAPQGGDKTSGNPYEPLAEDALSRIQGKIDNLYGMFVDAVVRNRDGKITAEAVKATKAQTFASSEALSNGLIDSIGAADDAMAVFSADLFNKKRGVKMSTQDDKPAAVDQTALDTARAEGRKEAQARIGAVLALDSAKDRPVLAHHLAMNTDMIAADADTLLKAAAKETKPDDSAMSFAQDMANTGKPAIGASVEGVESSDTDFKKLRLDKAMRAAGYIRKSA